MTRRHRKSRRQGTALVVVVVILVLAAGIASSVALAAQTGGNASVTQDAMAAVLQVADNAEAKALVRLKRDLATYKARTLNAPFQLYPTAGAEDGATVTGTRIGQPSPTSNIFELRARATVRRQTRSVVIIVRIDEAPPTPLSGPGLGAVIANGTIRVNGNITIDGRDHAPDGTLGGTTNVPGVLAVGVINQGGSSQIGGGTQAPSGSPTEGNGIDTSTTVWVRESVASGSAADDSDGVDDDGDGIIDENGFPTRPSGLFNLPDEAGLKARAAADGTFFTSKADYNTWLAAQTTPQDRGGKIIYIEVAPNTDIGQLNLPDNPPPARPNLFIVAGTGSPPSGNTVAGPVHVNGLFQGVFIGDQIDHVNGNGKIVGSVVTMNPQASRLSHFGNGAASIRFSSEVIANLPGPSDPNAAPTASLLSWREVR